MEEPPFISIGRRIRKLREAKGLSRQELARFAKIDVSSVSGWECGKRLPRAETRRRVARILGADVNALFRVGRSTSGSLNTASLIDTIDDLPSLLIDLTHRTRSTLRALRLAAPYPTPAFVQVDWRQLVDERIRNGTLTVERIEIFYDLRRLKEALHNIFRYTGCQYHLKSYCAGLTEVVPAIGGYFFDEDEFVLGAYWNGIPPGRRPGIRLSGAPLRRFFAEYWDEIWRRGTLLNVKGGVDLSAVRSAALALGLREDDWPRFVEEAQALDVGDGAPPLI